MELFQVWIRKYSRFEYGTIPGLNTEIFQVWIRKYSRSEYGNISGLNKEIFQVWIRKYFRFEYGNISGLNTEMLGDQNNLSLVSKRHMNNSQRYLSTFIKSCLKNKLCILEPKKNKNRVRSMDFLNCAH